MVTTMKLPHKKEELELRGPTGEKAIVRRSGANWVILYGVYTPINNGWASARWGNAKETLSDIMYFQEMGTVSKVRGGTQ